MPLSVSLHSAIHGQVKNKLRRDASTFLAPFSSDNEENTGGDTGVWTVKIKDSRATNISEERGVCIFPSFFFVPVVPSAAEKKVVNNTTTTASRREYDEGVKCIIKLTT